ncbi:hypothetical protein [Spiroplasma sp. BIUS-1]|uniref:hypothetical protein n=1 Tax=Spiroplasma sp. BIUS-1 TaxID=216964 RepID=UPI0013987C9D|nr:hypothetical protein [Spiroplasma sp. BIUS-1]QHX36518.1 hypothetical protein SBIUS_v1c02650 [Spiroplasma sp. BIUS-1]
MRIYLYSLKEIYFKKSSIITMISFFFFVIFFSLIDLFLGLDSDQSVQLIVMIMGNISASFCIWIFLVMHFHEEFVNKRENGSLNLEVRLKIKPFNIFLRRVVVAMVWLLSLYLFAMSFELIIKASFSFSFWYYYSLIISKYIAGFFINLFIICLMIVFFSHGKTVLSIISTFLINGLYLSCETFSNPTLLKEIEKEDGFHRNLSFVASQELNINYRINFTERALELKNTNNMFNVMCNEPEMLLNLYKKIQVNYNDSHNDEIVNWNKTSDLDNNNKTFYYLWKSGFIINAEDLKVYDYLKVNIEPSDSKEVFSNPFAWMKDLSYHLEKSLIGKNNFVSVYDVIDKNIKGMKKSDNTFYSDKEIKEIKEIIDLTKYYFELKTYIDENFVYAKYDGVSAEPIYERERIRDSGYSLEINWYLSEIFENVIESIMSTRTFTLNSQTSGRFIKIYPEGLVNEYYRNTKINYYLNPLASTAYFKNYSVLNYKDQSFSDQYGHLSGAGLTKAGLRKKLIIKDKDSLIDKNLDLYGNDLEDNVSFEDGDILVNRWIIFIEQISWVSIMFYITAKNWKRKLII